MVVSGTMFPRLTTLDPRSSAAMPATSGLKPLINLVDASFIQEARRGNGLGLGGWWRWKACRRVW